MIGLSLALIAGGGTYLLYTSLVLGWTGWRVAPAASARRTARQGSHDWLVQAGLEGTPIHQLAAVTFVLFTLGAAVAYAVFGGILGPLAAGAFAASLPLASIRNRRRARRDAARDAWPRLIEAMRLQTGALGRSVPQALFAVGRRGPEPLRPAFAAAQREWLLTTDFERAAGVVKSGLADPTADLVCETLVVAHQLGGADLDQRLAALAEDRWADLQHRKEARARQAGVRFANPLHNAGP